MSTEKQKSIFTKFCFCIPMMILSGILFTLLAWRMDPGTGPDEDMRFAVVNWIAVHSHLPTGFEEEIINPLWGYSYAFTPYLPSMISALFVKIAGIFSSSLNAACFAARLVNVFAGMGTVFVSFRVGDKLLDNRYSVYFMAGTVAFLPQFVFLSSCINNDIVSLLSAFMILDAVLDGARDGWKTRSMAYLSAGTALCLLTYYFGYAWVLFALAGFFCTSHKRGESAKATWRKAGLIALAVFVLAGWYFIRNGIIYHGDFLGYKTQALCASDYAASHNTYLANNPGKLSMHLRDMLHNGRWMETTMESFIGMFGGMIICLDGKFYDFYQAGFWLCILLFALYRYRTKEKISTALLIAFGCVTAFPVAFSIYSSYTRDYQPQGRYVFSIIPVLAVLAAVGIDEFSKAAQNKYKFGKYIPAAAAVILFLVFAVIYYTVMLPTLAYIILPGADRVMFYYVR